MDLVSRAGVKRLRALALAMPVFQMMVSDVSGISTHAHLSQANTFTCSRNCPTAF